MLLPTSSKLARELAGCKWKWWQVRDFKTAWLGCESNSKIAPRFVIVSRNVCPQVSRGMDVVKAVQGYITKIVNGTTGIKVLLLDNNTVPPLLSFFH